MTGEKSATLRRDEALVIIIDRLVRTGTSPTYDEIGRALNPKVCGTRARQLVSQLIDIGVIEKTPGALRSLRVRDVSLARSIAERFASSIGWSVAPPLGKLRPPFASLQLPTLPPFEHLPDVD